MLGAALVILLFVAFAWLGYRVMRDAATPFERLIAFGLTFLVTLQAGLNMAVVTVLTPTTGVPLPMLSAGGSGLLTVCIAIGILAGVARRSERLAASTPTDATG
jgi:cell division protein FtsW